MSSNSIQECAKMRASEADQFALASEPEAPRPKKPSRLRKPMFSLLPPKTENLTQTSRDAYEEQVKTLKQKIEGLEIENAQLKALRDEDQIKIEAADKANLTYLRTKHKIKKLEKEIKALEQQKEKAEEQSNTFTAKICLLDEALQIARAISILNYLN